MTHPTNDASPRKALPDIHEALLEPAELDSYFQDISQLAADVSVAVRRGPRDMGDGMQPDLATARRLLTEGGASGVQVRYQYQGAAWCDTLMRTATGVRLVRLRTDAWGDP